MGASFARCYRSDVASRVFSIDSEPGKEKKIVFFVGRKSDRRWANTDTSATHPLSPPPGSSFSVSLAKTKNPA